MPNYARTHTDMLQLCCGICGKKKNPCTLRTITSNILIKIRYIEGYQDYDLGNDRYPKKICNTCYFPVNERFSNPFKTEFNHKLPDIPNFSDISLPYIATRAGSVDYYECHCFLCEQNTSGRPKTKQESVTISQMCSKCYQKIGRGIQHPCLASPAKTAESISNAVKELDPKTQDQVLYSLLKSKSELNEKSKSDKIKIHTPGSFTSIQINPSTSKESPTLSTETIDNIRLQAGLSLNQTKLILGGIRADLGHHAVPAHYR